MASCSGFKTQILVVSIKLLVAVEVESEQDALGASTGGRMERGVPGRVLDSDAELGPLELPILLDIHPGGFFR